MHSSWYCLIVISFLFFGTVFAPKYPLGGFATSSGESNGACLLNTKTVEAGGSGALILHELNLLTGADFKSLLVRGIEKLSMFQPGRKKLVNSFAGASFVQPEHYEPGESSFKCMLGPGFYS